MIRDLLPHALTALGALLMLTGAVLHLYFRLMKP